MNKFYFTCACGCGVISEDLGRDYIRLKKGENWYNPSCTTEKIIKEFKNGVIVKENEF